MSAVIHIVDDDAAVRDSLKLLFESAGYKVETFASGEDFCARRDGGCDCLVLDVNLPGEDGFEVLAKLRRTDKSTPAIFMSGRADGQTRAKALKANAHAFFDKPVPPKDLLAAAALATARK